MEFTDSVGLNKGLKLISRDAGILSYITRLPRFHSDPKLSSYGIWPCDTRALGGHKYAGRSSGCGYSWHSAALTTFGEVVERYCPAFYRKEDLVKSSYEKLGRRAVNPNEIALFHEEQYKKFDFQFVPFTESLEVSWVKCQSLIDGKDIWYPGCSIYIPWVEKEEWIGLSTSTGLAGHTDLYEAILNGLYENIERDSFVIYWMQQPDVQKIVISEDIRKFLDANYPANYEFHFFDTTFDLETPTIFGMCFGEADFGKFVAVGSAARGTYGEALDKVIKEIGQAISYFRYILGERKDWYPTKFEDAINFEEHSLFYLMRQDYWTVFDHWRSKAPTKIIKFEEKRKNDTKSEIKRIVQIMDKLGYDVVFKNLTTPDIQEIGFHCVKIVIPQLLEMSGVYSFYFSGGKRLYEVPDKMGYKSKDYHNLNKFPHPFP